MTASRTRLDFPGVRSYFDDKRAGDRVDKFIADLVYALAVNYVPPVAKAPLVSETPVAFSDGATAPDISGAPAFKTANTSPTTITDFAGGVEGRAFYLLVNDSNTTIDFVSGTNITGHGGANLVAAVGDTLYFVYLGGKWRGFVSEA